MGLSAECIAMLECINKPAFFAEENKIIHVNHAAECLGISEKTNLLAIIEELTEENKVLTKPLNGRYFTVVTASIGDYTLYTLEQSIQQKQLLSLLRAAQHIRMPLAALGGCVNNLKVGITEEENPEVSLAIQKATKQLFALQRTVRNMAEIHELFETRYHKLKNVNPFEYFREMAEKLSTNFQDTNINISYKIANEYMYCSLDTELLERAVYNMVSNSLKAQSQNIHIELVQKGKFLNLTVSDDGHGISDEEKANILSKFQSEPSLNFEKSGLGLGMLIIHSAAVAHEGTVLITDAKPKGCKITLTLKIFKEVSTVRQTPIVISVDHAGGIDQMLIELADHLPPEKF